MSKTKEFRNLLQEPGSFILPGAYDSMSARLIEEIGFKAIYATGAGISNAQLGWADVGLTSLKEVVDIVTRMADVTTIPIVVDADTGFGNAINVMRTVREFERAGVAAIQMEDQVSPKKCGHFNGKDVISKGEMIGKIKAAVDTRTDENLAIIARTDALAVNSMEDALERAHAYREAGADIIFVEAPTTIEQLKQISTELKGIPQVLNMVEGGKTPLLSLEEAEKIGFKIMLCANTVLRSAIKGITASLKILKTEGSQENVHDLICTWEDRQSLFKLNQIKEWENKYADTPSLLKK
ncbi:carboxyvinyl-carboxyphosphonate phosphorylmutase [Bacillus sp. AFS076308]|uniref:isocitrate lyase/PEP mutase family protein n=1 Tax=unclassified Bacillus (in: firmicutes) TaxID=185979 RepID=UPI000BF804D7|nr:MULTISPECIES: oxaloacetate decarboxylase [unclassified Bacillus (in: firmicutes)]PFO05819.1 carboxyvinyl-carboxyphosphonate phosphorylmutase [Bacillus sp. AFS076308]PGV54153.1 carboxyvinyl-carboxyphosphonate phosphorylmutase [Bacillus sp. AFS037270]